jgi:hypothetical protein
MDKVSFREILFLLNMSRDLQTLLAAITQIIIIIVILLLLLIIIILI